MHTALKVKLAIYAAKNYLLLIFFYFVIGFAYFCLAHHQDWSLGDWLQATFFIQTDLIKTDSIAGLYTMIGTVVIMQGILALVFNRIEQNYNPAKSARVLASKMENHVVILGYGHFGKAIYKHCQEHGINIVVLERDEAVVKELVEDGGAVVVGDAADPSVLAEANIKKAHDVIQTFNNIRTALIVAHVVHTLNPKCEFHVRCADDQMSKILIDLKAKPFSTSLWILTKLREELPPPTEKTILVGYNNISQRFIDLFKEEKRPFVVVEEDPKKVASLKEKNIVVVEGCATAGCIVQATGADNARMAIICWTDRENDTLLAVREFLTLNPKMTVYARMYDDALVQVIEGMGAHTFSSSKFAFEKLKDDLWR